MSMNLDPRQRAMLAEMGGRIWTPVPVTSAPLPATPQPLAPATVSQAMPRTAVDTAPVKRLPDVKPVTAATPVPAFASLPLPQGLADMDWQQLQAAAASCRACGLCENRHHSVFADGAPASDNRPTDLLIIGDAPGDAEDASGIPFSGAEAVMLDTMLKAMGLSRPGGTAGNQGVVLVNALKCRGSNQRHPSVQEIQQCHSFLLRQIELLRPRVILALGRLAAQAVLHTQDSDAAQAPLGKLRGQVHQAHGCPVIVSYHPAYLMRTTSDKAKAWADLCLAMGLLKASAD